MYNDYVNHRAEKASLEVIDSRVSDVTVGVTDRQGVCVLLLDAFLLVLELLSLLRRAIVSLVL